MTGISPAMTTGKLALFGTIFLVCFSVFRGRCGEVRIRKRRDALSELLAQNARPHLLDLALRQIAELEGAERHPDQAVDREAEMAEHVLDLAVLAFAHRKGEPDIGALLAIERWPRSAHSERRRW